MCSHPQGLRRPRCGAPRRKKKLFGALSSDIHCARRLFNFRYRSVSHWIETFRTYYGPKHKAFAALDAQHQDRLSVDLGALLDRLNMGGPGSPVVPGEYLEVVITKH